MRNRFLGAMGVLLASASVGFSQTPYYYPSYGYQPAYYAQAPQFYYGYGYAPTYGAPASYQGVAPVSGTGFPVPPQPGGAPDKEILKNPPTEAAPPTPAPAPQVPSAAEGNVPAPEGTSPAPSSPAAGIPGLPLAGVNSGLDLAHGPACDGRYCHGGGKCDPRIWGTVEYLAWQIKDPPVTVPLLTTGSTVDAVPGAIGQPNTTVISPDSFHLGLIPGFRLECGGWLSDDRRVGLEATGFLLGSSSKSFSASSANFGPTQVLAVPAFIATTASEGVLTTSIPGANVLDATISSRSELYGAELNFLFHMYNNDWFSIGGLIGFRFLDLDEDLDFRTNLVGNPVTGVPPPPLAALGYPPNFQAVYNDHWTTHNQFYGGQVGLRAEFRYWMFFVDVMGKVAVGDMNQMLSLSGNSTFTSPTISQTAPGGTFNLVTNIGSQSRDQFAVVPEVMAQFGFEVNRYVRVFAGYDFLYANTVIRPGDNIDRNVNPAALPPIAPGTAIVPVAPSRLFNGSTFWAEGLTAGIELRY